MAPRKKPRTFTRAEDVIEYLSVKIISDQRSYREIAEDMPVSASTIANLATRKTAWPRPKTLFAVLERYNIHFNLD